MSYSLNSLNKGVTLNPKPLDYGSCALGEGSRPPARSESNPVAAFILGSGSFTAVEGLGIYGLAFGVLGGRG